MTVTARSAFANALEMRIRERSAARGVSRGWRLLYSPEAVLEGARVALIGAHPGGYSRPDGQAEFAMASGSAYEVEHWAGAPAGEHSLQRQVRALFARLGETPQAVLAGNLIPFRSPSLDKLEDRRNAIEFGRHLWSDILARARPEVVITMGKVAADTMSKELRVDASSVERVPLCWGPINGTRGNFERGVLVSLPHLSRFRVLDRPQSSAAVDRLLHGLCR